MVSVCCVTVPITKHTRPVSLISRMSASSRQNFITLYHSKRRHMLDLLPVTSSPKVSLGKQPAVLAVMIVAG